MATEIVKESVESGVLGKLQPWQALFGILTYVVTQFNINDSYVLILCALLAGTLGFAMVSNYKHKEAMKEVITPFLVDQVLKILKDYIPAVPEPAPEPEPEPEPVVVERIVYVERDPVVNYTSDTDDSH